MPFLAELFLIIPASNRRGDAVSALFNYSFRPLIMLRSSHTNTVSNQGFLTNHGWLRGEGCASGR